MPKHGRNIRRRSDGRWEGRYKYLCTDNSYKYRSIYGKTCGEVKEKLDAAILQQSRLESILQNSENKPEENEKYYLGDIARKWLGYILETKKYSTYRKYRITYEKHIRNALSTICVSDISSSLIQERIFQPDPDIVFSQALKCQIVAIVNQILNYATEHYGYSTMQLENKVQKNKGKKIEVINHSEQAALFRYLYTDMDTSKGGILLCMMTGLRLGEVCSLKWTDIDWEQQIIHVKRTVQRIATDEGRHRTMLMVSDPKSEFSIREIPFSKGIASLLSNIRHHEEYVLGGRKPLEPRTCQNRFKRYLRDAGIKEYNFHVLRHTFATNCIDNGMDVKCLSEILGHADVQITLNRYTHPTLNTKRRQIALLDSVYGQFCGQQQD